jgi:hypothetical protein
LVVWSIFVIFAAEINLIIMASRKKSKKEVTKELQPEVVTSNKEEKKKEEITVPTMEDYENSKLLTEATMNAILAQSPSAEGIREKVVETLMNTDAPEPKKEEKPKKLHVLADDRLNSLINRANELGITNVVEVLNSDKFGQFYMVYWD